MTETTRIDGPYGYERIAAPNPTEPGTPLGSAVPRDTPVVLNDSLVAQDAGFKQARAAREARALRPDPTVLESLGAAVSQWDTTKLLARIGRPSFDDDTPINPAEYLDHVPLVLTKDERDYFIDVAKGSKSAEYAMDQIKDKRMAAGVVGDHPVAGLLGAFADPLWLVVPPAIRIGKLAGPAGRLASGAAGAGLAGAVTALGEGPVSDEEIAMSMLMNGAAAAAFFRGGRLVQADPEFPTAQLQSSLKPRYKLNSDGTRAEVLPKSLDAGKFEIDPKTLAHHTDGQSLLQDVVNRVQNPDVIGVLNIIGESGLLRNVPVHMVTGDTAHPLFKSGAAAVTTGDTKGTALYFRTDLGGGIREDAIVHEALHAVTVAAIERNPAIRAELTALSEQIGATLPTGPVKDFWKRMAQGNAEESLAYGLTSPTIRKALSELGDTANAGRSMWQRLTDTVRRWLGLPESESARFNDVLGRLEGHLESLVADTETHGLGLPVSAGAPQVAHAVDMALSTEAKKRGLGHTLQWNMHKTMQGYGEVGKRVADLFFDNNSDLSITSMEAHREAIMSELRSKQYVYEDLLRQAVKDDGYGVLKMAWPGTSRKAYEVQAGIELQVQRELFRREQEARTGKVLKADIPERITKMADALDDLHARALHELKSAGVKGAEELEERPGYLNRRWSSGSMDQAFDRLEAKGLTREQARAKVTDLVSFAVRRGNVGMNKDVAETIGRAIVDRALRRGYFEDASFNGFASAAKQAEVRDILKGGKADPALVDRVMQSIMAKDDEAGKAGYLKHRMDIDYKASINVNGETLSVSDLIDGRVGTIVDQYVSRASTQAAFARKGFITRTDIERLRQELVKDIPDVEKRKEAVQLFDNALAHFRGDPAGANVNANFRLMQSYGRSISLAWSGLWQFTEFATAMAEYGLAKTLKYAAQEIPGFRELAAGGKQHAESLNVVLAEHSAASLRMRPYMAKFEDGYEMNTTQGMQLSAQTIGQTVPFANAMRYVHHTQAKIVGNLILDRVRLATKGDTNAIEALQKYGIEAPVMDKLRTEIQTHGFNVDAWDDKVWEATRPSFAKMMDAAVLRSRLGDTPAFAAFDQVGKFVFTYRSFVLTAHNKVLAGMLERNGAGAVGLVLMYQLPLTLLAVQTQAAITGQGPLSPGDMVKKGLGQMGGLGLFSEPLKWATGESNSVGAPALIPIDRSIKLFQAGLNLDPKQFGGTALTMMPTISAIPFVKGMAQQIKE